MSREQAPVKVNVGFPVTAAELGCLANAQSVVEVGFVVKDGFNAYMAETGERYVTVCSGGIKSEGGPLPVVCDTIEQAVTTWRDAVLAYARGRSGTLYWRWKPHLESVIRDDRRGFLVFSRLLISRKPAAYVQVGNEFVRIQEAKPMTSRDEAAIESEIQAKNLNAPRLSPAAIEAAILTEQYWQPEGTVMTVCALTLQNGFNVVGHSAPASPENFNAELGRKIARDKAREQIWQLEGYLLRDRLHNAGR